MKFSYIFVFLMFVGAGYSMLNTMSPPSSQAVSRYGNLVTDLGNVSAMQYSARYQCDSTKALMHTITQTHRRVRKLIKERAKEEGHRIPHKRSVPAFLENKLVETEISRRNHYDNLFVRECDPDVLFDDVMKIRERYGD